LIGSLPRLLELRHRLVPTAIRNPLVLTAADATLRTHRTRAAERRPAPPVHPRDASEGRGNPAPSDACAVATARGT
jgi:hypothetical protein